MQLVNALWHHRGALVGTVAAIAAAVGTWYALTGRVDTVDRRQVEQAQQVDALRTTHTEDMRQLRTYVDTRFEATGKAQQEAEKNIAVLNARLDAIDKALAETRDNTRLLLDRLNASPRGRTVRDYP